MCPDYERTLRNICKVKDSIVRLSYYAQGDPTGIPQQTKMKRVSQLGRGSFGFDGSTLGRPSDW